MPRSTMLPEHLGKAVRLAHAVLERRERQPVPLSNDEAMLLATAVTSLTAPDDSHDMIEDRVTALHPRIPFTNELEHLNWLSVVLDSDENGIIHAEESYRGSWKRRGGIGAFMMLARKWDRLESRTEAHNYNIFDAIALDKRREGVIDDVRDLRRYLTLVECQMILARAIAPEGGTKDSDAVR